MSATMALVIDEANPLQNSSKSQQAKGVKQLHQSGINKVPTKYILPIHERPNSNKTLVVHHGFKLPVIDCSELKGQNRSQVIKSLVNACEHYGFFQLVNHGIPLEVTKNMTDLSRRFFELPYENRSKYMSSDIRAPIRYGTSFNQSKDKVFCWRDFLKLTCNPPSQVLPHWPCEPFHFREVAESYAKETKYLFLMIMEAILESLWRTTTKEEAKEDEENLIMEELKDGSQLMVLNCYPPCPEPDLTVGMPPHSDYGFLTLLLQDEVEGLQIQHKDKWVTVEPIPNAFVVNVGDHLEIFSNGRYKSVLHRVVVNSMAHRYSIASLHSLPIRCTIRPSPRLIHEEENQPRRYKDTDFATFLDYILSHEPRKKEFLESRKLY